MLSKTSSKKVISTKIIISLSLQSLSFVGGENFLDEYSISSGLKGIGCEKNSGKTPLGKHIVRAKIGQDEPLNTVFVARRATGEIYTPHLAQLHPNRDWILTRILWLSGCEKGKNRLGNVDTMQRYIYIHGTPDSEPMGIALSQGCIRMRNTDLVKLFDEVEVGAEVIIEA